MDVIVVGGGAAGMMAAIAAADSGGNVCLIEKNEKLGKKLFITGKGRCNVTNAGDMDTLFANVRINSKFLYSAFYDYDNRAVMDFLEKAGCPLKIERGERVFPRSDHSSDVIGAFQRELKKRGVKIVLNTEVRELVLEEGVPGEFQPESETVWQEANGSRRKKDGEVSGRSFAGVRLSDGQLLRAQRCIVCTGGLSYPSTGSTGDGYRFAEETGHEIRKCEPGLVPFRIRESWCGRLMGLSLKNVSLRMVSEGKEVYQGFGEMLFTHFGVSGPLVLSASSFYGKGGKRGGRTDLTGGTSQTGGADRQKRGAGGETMLYLDLKPALDTEQLDRRLLRDFEENKNRQFKNSLGKLFPAKLIPVMTELSGIDPEKKVNEISREERRRFVGLIKCLSMTVEGLRGFEEAIITRGGVNVRDVNPSTMESKKVRGLYFAGEVLDLDALTGGFNLQIAWSTGHLAGSSVR